MYSTIGANSHKEQDQHQIPHHHLSPRPARQHYFTNTNVVLCYFSFQEKRIERKPLYYFTL